MLSVTLFSLALSTAESVTDVPPRRGAFAFQYAPSLTREQIDRYSQFEVLVTHDPIPLNQVRQLHAAGTKLLFYEWSVAFYESRATEWQRSLLESRRQSLLNKAPLTGGVGSSTAASWYFDPASPNHAAGRARDIADRLESSGYDGVFFDTTTIESVHPEARAEYERRHPGIPYDLAFSRFLARLRKERPNGIIFTNQGYRSAEHYLPHVDWDLTESLMTWPREGSFQLRPWNDSTSPWNSMYFLMQRVIAPMTAAYPHVRFGHLNYAGRHDSAWIRLTVALAQIFGGEAFLATPEPSDEIDPIYFRDPGQPTSGVIDSGGRVIHRHFENGMIVITAADSEVAIDKRGHDGLRDHFSGRLVCGDVMTIPASEGQPRAYFFDATDDCPASR